MGSSKSKSLNRAVQDIWEWALERDNWLTAAHIPGILNIEADEESRSNEVKTEWKLDPSAFAYVLGALGYYPEVDMFASRINKQLPRFYSYRPDPDAELINAFTTHWGGIKFYAFPPFSIVGRGLQKILQDKASGIIIVPDWPNQVWYHLLSEITISSIILPPRRDLLHLPNNLEAVHPLHHHLHLKACYVSGTGL